MSERFARFASRVASQTISGLAVAAIAAVMLAIGGYASDAVTGGGLIRLLGGVTASDVEDMVGDRATERAAGSGQAVTLIAETSLDAAPNTPYQDTVCIAPGQYFLAVRGVMTSDGRYLGRARLVSDPPGTLVDLRAGEDAPLTWGFVTTSEAACYRLLATAPARLYWLLDW